jgi:hypothetical protein
MTLTYRDWFAERVILRSEIDDFLNDDGTNWMQFEPEVGYVLSSSHQTEGMGGCGVNISVDPDGNRKMINYADRPCRINTYGDSFTQSSQVSDGETWQEVLAAHLGEPIRNFGVGGFGAYQAYRRMLQEEQRLPAKNIIFYIWGDDHQRSFMPCRALLTGGWNRAFVGRRKLHGNPWAHLDLDLDSGEVIEVPNSHPTPESLYDLCDPDKLHVAFSDNLVYQLTAFGDGVADVDTEKIRRLAAWAEMPDPCHAEDRKRACDEVFRKIAHRGSMYILDRLTQYAAATGKNAMVILGYGQGVIEEGIRGEPRGDAEIIAYLQSRAIRFVDMRTRHVEDSRQFNLSPAEYVQRYYIGHYNPLGNVFFAFSIRGDVVDWIEPKPPTYRHL